MVIPPDVHTQLRLCLDKALEREKAGMGNIRVFYPEKKVLRIVVQKGFGQEFLTYFNEVDVDDSSVCGRAMCMGAPVVVGDVELDADFAPHRHIARSAGFRSVKSIPLLFEGRAITGTISLHCKDPRWSWNIQHPADLAEIARLLASIQR